MYKGIYGFLSPTRAAYVCWCSRRTIQKLHDAGLLRAIRVPGSTRLRIEVGDIYRLLLANNEPTARFERELPHLVREIAADAADASEPEDKGAVPCGAGPADAGAVKLAL